MTLQEILDNYEDTEFLIADGFDDAVMGLEIPSMRLIYSVKKVIEILIKEMNYEDAVQHFEYNVAGSYVGENTPI